MTDIQILMKAPMVRALLDESKTQTRRVVKGVKHIPSWGSAVGIVGGAWKYGSPAALGLTDRGDNWGVILDDDHLRRMCTREAYGWGAGAGCPYGQPGDRLWVRETWMPDPPRDGTWSHVAFDGCRPRDMSLIPERYRTPKHCLYRADGHEGLTGWTPAIHMFRWASRITLEVTSVRVERLQDISEADAKAEGCDPLEVSNSWSAADIALLDMPLFEPENPYRNGYAVLWEYINGPGSWDANPLVWVVNFKRIKP